MKLTKAQQKERKAQAKREANRTEDLLLVPLPDRVRMREARARPWKQRSEALATVRAREVENRKHLISFEDYKALPEKEKAQARMGAGRGRIVGTDVSKKAASARDMAIENAIRAYFGDYPKSKTDPKFTAEKIAGDLRKFGNFPDNFKLGADSTFLRKVRECLRKHRPRWNAV